MDNQLGTTEEGSEDLPIPPWQGIQAGHVMIPEPFVDKEPSDVRAIKLIVSFTLGITIVLAAGYIAAVVLTDGAVLLRPSEVALERHELYESMVNHPGEEATGSGVKACIVDSGIDLDHGDFANLNLAGWKDFINGQSTPYDLSLIHI